MAFSEIPLRSNGERILQSWFNKIRSELINVFGAGTTNETQQTVNDNDTQDITGLLFSSATYITANIEFTIVRGTQRATGLMRVFFRTAGWDRSLEVSGDDTGIVLNINSSTGQVSYTSTSTGIAGKIKHKVISTFNLEI